VKELAREQGASLINIFKYTNFSTPTEYFDKTTGLDREFLMEAVKQYEQEKADQFKN